MLEIMNYIVIKYVTENVYIYTGHTKGNSNQEKNILTI